MIMCLEVIDQINRLYQQGVRVYLGGPMHGCTAEEYGDWRAYVTKVMGEDLVLNPLRNGSDKTQYVELDKIDIERSSALIVNYDHTKQCVGTSMETLYAWERGKFIVVIIKEGIEVPPWLEYHSHKVVHHLDDAILKVLERFA